MFWAVAVSLGASSLYRPSSWQQLLQLQLTECWSRDPGSRVQFPLAGGLGVGFFATGPGWVLKCYLSDTWIYLTLKNNLSVDKECTGKCQVLSLNPYILVHRHYHLHYIYWTLAQAQGNGFCSSVGTECWSRDPGSQVQFPAGGFGVAFFASGTSWILNVCLFDTQIFLTLKNNLSINKPAY